MQKARVYIDLSLDDWRLVQEFAEREFPEVKDSRERNKAAIRRIIRLWCSRLTPVGADAKAAPLNSGSWAAK